MIDLAPIRKAREALREGNIYAAIHFLDAFADEHTYNMADKAVIDEADRLRKARYVGRIEQIAQAIAEDWAQGVYSGRVDELAETLNDAATTSHFDDAQDALLFSTNTQEIDPHNVSWANDIPWCELAFYVIRADIIEELHNMQSINVYDTPPDEPVQKCGCCGEWKPRKECKNGVCEADQ